MADKNKKDVVKFFPPGYAQKNWKPEEIPGKYFDETAIAGAKLKDPIAQKYFLANAIAENRWGKDYGNGTVELPNLGVTSDTRQDYQKRLGIGGFYDRNEESDYKKPIDIASQIFQNKVSNEANRIYDNPTDSQRIALWNGVGRKYGKNKQDVVADADNHSRKVIANDSMLVQPENKELLDRLRKVLMNSELPDSTVFRPLGYSKEK